ncbi:hypothetical protein TNCV_1636001 [Trichonephila clavipes]|nr:hypothetical protein TNCV_1636001 [Trichonephila clavipes]
MHPLLENINLFDISSLTEENVKDILTEARVLPEKTSPLMCPICRNETSANRDSSRKLGWMWICKKKYQLKCSGKVNPTSNTFFENVKIHVLDVFVLIVCFVIKLQISLVLDQLNMFGKRRLQEMSWATIVDFYARLRDVTEIIGSHHDKLLGGPGYGKEGLQLRKIEVLTAESEGISDMMPKTFNKKLLNGDDDDEVNFVNDEDGDPNWEEF